MKYLLFALMFVVSTSFSYADDGKTMEGEGHVFYKMKDGDLVKRDVTLFVTEKEEGKEKDVYMVFGEDKKVKAARVKIKKGKGRYFVTLLFKDVPGAPKGAFSVFRGSYLQGNNLGVFYGDVFGGKKGGPSQEEEEEIEEGFIDDKSNAKPKIRYVGGFGFKFAGESETF